MKRRLRDDVQMGFEKRHVRTRGDMACRINLSSAMLLAVLLVQLTNCSPTQMSLAATGFTHSCASVDVGNSRFLKVRDAVFDALFHLLSLLLTPNDP